MKIVFFNRFFHPDTSATSQLLSDLAFHLAGKHHEVHVVTSHPGGEPASSETLRGVKVHRVAAAMTGPHSLFERAAAYGRYYVGARRLARQLLVPGDVAVIKTDPPLLSSAIAHIAKARGARVIVWLQDLFPEVAKEYGIPGMGGVSGALLRRVRNLSLSAADDVVAIANTMAARVAKTDAVSRERLHVVHNWSDGHAIVPMEHAGNPLRSRWGLQDRFVVGYSGNLGRVHEFDTILDAASRLRAEPDIQFLFIGRGPRLAQVRRRVELGQLTNVRFEPHQERGLLGQSLGVPDVHLSVLRPEFEGLVHPSKLYGIMAAGRPTIYVGSARAETAMILSECGAGVTVETGDGAALAAAILRLRGDRASRRAMGESARRAYEAKYDMPIALREWERILGL